MNEAISANRRLWNAWTPVHAASQFYDVDSFRDGRRPIRLADYERHELGDVTGKRLLHLQCHFGLDTLSWARLGADVTGVDFSAEGVAAARRLADELDIAAKFIESDVYELPNRLDAEFDVVYASRGVLWWLPDVISWARVAAHFVRPGGIFYVTDLHPTAQVFENEGVRPGELRLAYPYWTPDAPLRFDVQGSYADRHAPTDGLTEFGWPHALGEIVTAVIDARLQLEFLHEFDFVEWPVDFLVEGDDGRWRLPPGEPGQLPLFFSLRARRPA